jgi:hypothetical protein
MFFSVTQQLFGGALVSLVPQIGTAATALSHSALTVISSVSFLQLPVVATVGTVALQLFAAYACFHVARKVLAVVVGHIVYPAAIVSRFTNVLGYTNKWRTEAFDKLTAEGYIVKRLTLKKSGVSYDAFLIGKRENIRSGKWSLKAFGNGFIAEYSLYDAAKYNSEKFGVNILVVNGPSVGSSGGWPTAYQMGAAQEAGMQYLEKVVKGKEIILQGHSLGGGAIGKAVLSHDFSMAKKNGIRYLAISDRTFDKLSNVAGSLYFRLANPILRFLGMELDSLRAAKKLKKEGIHHIVTQRSDYDVDENRAFRRKFVCDGVIPGEASLPEGLESANLLDPKHTTLLHSPFISHNDYSDFGYMSGLSDSIQAQLVSAVDKHRSAYG